MLIEGICGVTESRITEKSGVIRKRQENICTRYAVSDYVELYVDVRLTLFAQECGNRYETNRLCTVRFKDRDKTFWKQNEHMQEQTQVKRFIFSNLLHPSASPLQSITAAESKRSLSLCSSVQPELESDESPEPEHALPVLKHHRQLLGEYHLLKVTLCSCQRGRPPVRHPRVLSHQKLMVSPQLASHMPPKTLGYPWQLVYSTGIHGKSLQTL